MDKLIVIIGITGTQGASVADVFLKEPGWKVRGVSRNPDKPDSKAWTEKGAEVVKADINDPSSLILAFKGATVIFGVTDFWHPFYDPENQKKFKPGQTINQFCYDLEFTQGRNIADAAATVESLERYVWSSLSSAKKWSKGKYTWAYHLDAKAYVDEYIKEKQPKLWEKTSVLQVGFFLTNWQVGIGGRPQKQPDGSYKIMVQGDGNRPLPQVVTRKDTGYFVRALVQVPPGKKLLGYGSLISWKDYIKLWCEIQGVPNGGYQEITVEDYDKAMPGGLGREVGEMYAYAGEFGYDGSDPSIIHPKDLGVPCPTTSIEEYFKTEDWSSVM